MASQSHYRGVVEENTTIIPGYNMIGNNKHPNGSYIIKPKALDIIWGSDSRYWRLPKCNDGPVELLQVSWLEATGWIELRHLEPKTYKLSFTVSMQPDAFGWKGSPVYMMAKVGQERLIWKSADLSGRPVQTPFKIPGEHKFTVTAKDHSSGDKLRFGLYEVWKGRWKGGLVIHQVEITPLNA